MRVLFLIIVVALGLTAHLFGHEPDNNAVGLFSGLQANNEAIRQFDVLIRSEEEEDNPVKDARHSVCYHRLKVDLDTKESFCCSRLRVVEKENGSTQEGDEKISQRDMACIFAEGKGQVVRFPISKPRLYPSFEATMNEMGCPDIRTIGLPHEHFPIFGSELDFSRTSKVLVEFATAKVTEVPSEDLQISVDFEVLNETPNGEKVGYRRLYLFDPKKNLPKSRKNWNLFRGQAHLVYETSYEFIEKDNLYLPVEAFQVGKAARSNKETRDVWRYNKTTILQVHWFSVNEPLDRSSFDPANLTDWNQLRNLCDPVIAGADTLPQLGTVNAK